jgi:L-ascorbate metabolism protein UlaG (beta-lactamase superfamily)
LTDVLRFAVVIAAGCASTAPIVASPPRAPIAFTYLGVAGWVIESGDTVVVTDPYLTRPDRTKPAMSDPAAVAAHSPVHADVVLVGHSHVDHLLDAPAVAIRTGATLVGSLSTIRVGRASGVDEDHLQAVKGGEDLERKGYSIRVIPSLHSEVGAAYLFGEIRADVKLPMMMDDYQEGGTLAYLIRIGGHEVVVLDTANFIERELAGIHPDIAIIAPHLGNTIHDYTCRLLHVLGDPPIVLPTHFDDWKGPPVDGPREELAEFTAEVHRCSPASRVIAPRHFVRFAP